MATTPPTTPPAIAPTFGPSLWLLLLLFVAPDRAALTHVAAAQLLHVVMVCEHSSSLLHTGQLGAMSGHCKHRLKRLNSGPKSINDAMAGNKQGLQSELKGLTVRIRLESDVAELLKSSIGYRSIRLQRQIGRH